MTRHPVADLLRTLAAPAGHPAAGPGAGPAAPKAVSVVHYGPDGASVATTGKASYAVLRGGGLSVSYEAALVGGAPASHSEVALDGQGVPQNSTTRLMTADGSPGTTVNADYGGLSLTAVGTPLSGAVALAVADAKGRQTHTARMSYAAEACAHYALTTLDATGAVQDRTAVDYAGALMAGTRLVGGTLAVSRTDLSGRALSSARSHLTRQGVPAKVAGTNYDADGKTPRLLVESNYAGVAFNALRKVQAGQLVVTTQAAAAEKVSTATVFAYRNGKLISSKSLRPGQVVPAVTPAVLVTVPGPWTPPRPADRTAQVKRPDGSLIEQRNDWFMVPGKTGTPRRSVIALYATDGKTVIRIMDVDYAGTTFDSSGNPAGGTVVSTQFQAGVRSSITHVSY